MNTMALQYYHRGSNSMSKRLFVWDPKFSKRNPRLYPAENKKTTIYEKAPTRLDAFFKERAHELMPPQYSYAALKEFLGKTSPEKLNASYVIAPNSPDADKLVILDQRMDPSPLNTFGSRYWAEYAAYPPSGDFDETKTMNARELYDLLNTEVSILNP